MATFLALTDGCSLLLPALSVGVNENHGSFLIPEIFILAFTGRSILFIKALHAVVTFGSLGKVTLFDTCYKTELNFFKRNYRANTFSSIE